MYIASLGMGLGMRLKWKTFSFAPTVTSARKPYWHSKLFSKSHFHKDWISFPVWRLIAVFWLVDPLSVLVVYCLNEEAAKGSEGMINVRTFIILPYCKFVAPILPHSQTFSGFSFWYWNQRRPGDKVVSQVVLFATLPLCERCGLRD